MIMPSSSLVGRTIEQELLVNDRRGVSELLPHLSADFVERAAAVVLQTAGTVLIVTGFYVNGSAETDGPPGAIAIGNALQRLGRPVAYVTDGYAAHLLRALVGEATPVIEVAIQDHEASRAACLRVLHETSAGLVIAVERCGQTRDGSYLNMGGEDISAHTAKLDYLFNGVASIGIGDGGNEIGMGTVHEAVRQSERLVREPTVTAVDELVIASVSNWGAYGLVAAMSRQCGQDLLPTAEEAQSAIIRIVDLGAVDGISGSAQYSVDGFTLDDSMQLLERLRAIVLQR